LSDELIAEIQDSDTLLLAVPIYNFSIPAALKAWIDQVMRIGHTFSMDETGFKGLVKARRAVIVCAYGAEGYLQEEPFAAANFLEPYLKFLFTFLGIERVEFVHVQGTATAAPEAFAERLDDARTQAREAA
jgi:FMN-dependent NADH-azoreductase